MFLKFHVKAIIAELCHNVLTTASGREKKGMPEGFCAGSCFRREQTGTLKNTISRQCYTTVVRMLRQRVQSINCFSSIMRQENWPRIMQLKPVGAASFTMIQAGIKHVNTLQENTFHFSYCIHNTYCYIEKCRETDTPSGAAGSVGHKSAWQQLVCLLHRKCPAVILWPLTLI